MVAVYTEWTVYEEAQSLAVSHDGGYTYHKYKANPVLSREQHGFRDPSILWHKPSQRWIMTVARADEGMVSFYSSANFTDWKHLSNFRTGLDGAHECPFMAEFPAYSRSGKLSDSVYVLFISFGWGSTLPVGGSVIRYFSGNFNGTHFQPAQSSSSSFSMLDMDDGDVATGNRERKDKGGESLDGHYIGHGPDNYAARLFDNTDASKPLVAIGWATNTMYAGNQPSGPREGWAGLMTGPREMYLANVSSASAGWDLITRPYNLSPVLSDTLLDRVRLGGVDAPVFLNYHTVPSRALLVTANLTCLESASAFVNSSPPPAGQLPLLSVSSRASGGRRSGTVGLLLSSSVGSDSLAINITVAQSVPKDKENVGNDEKEWEMTVAVDRSRAMGDWVNDDFARPFSVPVPSVARHVRPSLDTAASPAANADEGAEFTFEMVLDRSIAELYLNGGVRVATVTFFPDATFDQLRVLAPDLREAGIDASLSVQALKSAKRYDGQLSKKNKKHTSKCKGKKHHSKGKGEKHHSKGNENKEKNRSESKNKNKQQKGKGSKSHEDKERESVAEQFEL